MAKRPFLLLYINDFLSAPSVLVMDNDQFSWYLRLLMHAWQNEPACCLPNKDYILMTWAGVRDNKKERLNWDAKKRLVLDNFAQDESGVWLRNSRLDAEYAKMVQVDENNKERGKRGAEARWSKDASSISKQCSPMQNDGNSEVICQKSEVIQDQKQKPAPLALPDWIPLAQWNAFVDSRKKLRSPMTVYAQELLIKKLDSARSRGQPIDKMLERAIEGGWKTVYDIDGGNHQAPETKMKSAKQVIEERK